MPSAELPARDQQYDGQLFGGNAHARPRLLKSLNYTGTLDSFTNQDLTPVIGREYEGLQVRDLLRWGDEMIRDLAVTSEPSPTPVVKFAPCPDLTVSSFFAL